MKKYGLGPGLRNFETLMSTVGAWHQSIWELKKFTHLPNPDPTRAAVVDYGFMNCVTAQ